MRFLRTAPWQALEYEGLFYAESLTLNRPFLNQATLPDKGIV